MKLDEIKELILSNCSTQAKEPAVDLLIRAVRQLESVYIHDETCNSVYAPHVKPNHCDCLEDRVDPDVLELLEAEDE